MGTKADEKNRKPLPGESKGAGVQSAKGGAVDSSQTMHSVNEDTQPVVPAINTYAQTEAIRAENKAKAAQQPAVAQAQQVMADAAQQHYQDQLYKNQQAQAEYNEKYGTTNPAQNANSNYLKFEGTAFNETAADERLKNSETFKSMLKRAQDEDAQARQKAESASRYAKAAAWGNMFTALGQLAGAGKNTYVAPDQTYLKSALSKADKARELYDAIQAKNRNAESQYRAAFMDNERKAHMEAEKLRKGAIDEYNKLIQKDAKDRNELTLKQAQYQLDAMYKAGVLSNQQYANKTARLKAMHDIEKDKEGKTPFLKQTVNGFVYSGDKADAGELAEIIRSTGWQNRGKLGGVDAAALNLVLSGQMENVDPVSFNRVVASFLSDEGNVRNPRVQDFLRRMKVAKATDNSSITKPKISIQ